MDLAVIRTLSLWQHRIAEHHDGTMTVDVADALDLVAALATAVSAERTANATITELRAEMQRMEAVARYRPGM